MLELPQVPDYSGSSALKKDVLSKVFKVNEINEINSEIMDLSGFDKNLSDDIKKLIETDSNASLSYFLFKEKGMLPSEFYKLSYGERIVLSVYCKKLMEDKLYEYETIKFNNLL